MASDRELIIRDVIVDCGEHDCDDFRLSLEEIAESVSTIESLRERARIMALEQSIKSFSFDVYLNEDETFSLLFEVELWKKIVDITYNSNVDISLEHVGRGVFSKGGYYNPNNRRELKALILERMKELGMFGVDVNIKAKTFAKGVKLVIDVHVDKILNVKRIEFVADNDILIAPYRNRFRRLIGRPWDRIGFRVLIDEFVSELTYNGFFNSRVTYSEKDQDGDILVKVDVHFGPRFNFSFRGNTIFSREEILEYLRGSLANSLTEIDEPNIKTLIDDLYVDSGFYDTELRIRTVSGKTKDKIDFHNFYIEIKEGEKLKVKEISFTGNNFFTDDEIYQMFRSEGTVLSKRGFLDLDFKNNFINFLKLQYLKNGFVFVEVETPYVDRDGEGVSVEFRVKEFHQVFIEDVKLSVFSHQLSEELLASMVNKPEKVLNITELQSDFRRILDHLNEKGFFYARINNINDDSILEYSSDFKKGTLNIEVNKRKKTLLDTVLIRGLSKTKAEVVEREIGLERYDELTPRFIDQLRQRLNFLGLFSLIEITPFISNQGSEDNYYLTNLLIEVREKDFGMIELAPGYRTDIGVKVSSDITYNNLWGMNRAISLRTEVNQRLDFANLDQRRRDDEKRMLEFSVRGSYNEPYLFGSDLQFNLSAGYQRRRFFSFDADIRRFSPEVSRQLTRHVTATLQYQFETIRQFDATENRDSGSFRIGSITPSLSFDFRDNPIMPSRGAFFGLSWEFANPAFGSLDTDELVVNFHKLVSRNQFYIPAGDWTIATSFSFGYEKNLSNDIRLDEDGNPVVDDAGNMLRTGFIPSIKVFRLDGVDIVRGFSDREINRLGDGRGVSEVPVEDEAFFVNLKVEPRYYLNDSLMMGVFFDAGRVFIDSFQPLDLRASTGLTLKVVTPVGSLDFDYGVKARRLRGFDSGRETFGRFHLSIGHF